MDTTNKTPEAFKISGDWAPQAKQLKEKFAQLSDTDLAFEPGKETDLLNRIGAKINKKRDEVINIIKKGLVELG